MSVLSDTEDVRIPEPDVNLNLDDILTLVCWKLHLVNAVGQESVLWEMSTITWSNLTFLTKHSVKQLFWLCHN